MRPRRRQSALFGDWAFATVVCIVGLGFLGALAAVVILAMAVAAVAFAWIGGPIGIVLGVAILLASWLGLGWVVRPIMRWLIAFTRWS
jgi:hypothetical protein